jgi:hypothetical protein
MTGQLNFNYDDCSVEFSLKDNDFSLLIDKNIDFKEVFSEYLTLNLGIEIDKFFCMSQKDTIETIKSFVTTIIKPCKGKQ